MLSSKKIEGLISLVLFVGMMLSICLVIFGSSIYLFQHGSESIHFELMPPEIYSTNLYQIWEAALAFSPSGIIELGLVTLVATQILRVVLLVWYYGSMRDYWFFFISLFVVTVLVYSFFFP